MTRFTLYTIPLALIALCSTAAGAAPAEVYPFSWSTVVNNGDYMPTDRCDPAQPTPASCRRFNSYNQPSVNADRLVVMRARSRGGQGFGQPVHGIYTRDMAVEGPVVRILDRDTEVPQPNNTRHPPDNPQRTTFTEPPSFPRIDIGSDTIATRGNHQPVWQYALEGGETRAGTTGLYTNPFGPLIAGASKLGGVPAFAFLEVPERPGTPFDVFPGAPAVTDGATLVFKGNYTVDLVGKTGVYYRDLMNASLPGPDDTSLAPAGGSLPAVLIANNSDTLIPGTSTPFGSTAPPSAAGRLAVFAGFDNEEQPTLGGIYLAPLDGPQPELTTLISIGGRVPDEKSKSARFNRLSEGLSFDGRFVAFWGAWGTATRTLVLQCPNEGSEASRAYCLGQHPNGFAVQVPLRQGIFVHDIRTGKTRTVAKSPGNYDDFLFWTFSGRIPGAGEGGEEGDEGEAARWRSSAFVAVSGTVDGSLTDAGFHTVFKARRGKVAAGVYVDPVDGIHLRKGPGNTRLATLIETGMDGTLLDSEAVDADTGEGLPVTALGVERDGFRGNAVAINASMGSEEVGWSGIYLTEVPR